MKSLTWKYLITNVALVLLTSTAHADKLPKTEPLIGSWCAAKKGNWTLSDIYERQPSDGFNCSMAEHVWIGQDGFSQSETNCSFSMLKQLANRKGWFAISKCHRASEEAIQWNDKIKFWRVGKMLALQYIASTIGAGHHENSCGRVEANVPDGFLNLRAGPGTKFKVNTKLLPGDELEITDVTNDDWKRVYVQRLMNKNDGGYGWVRGKFIKKTEC